MFGAVTAKPHRAVPTHSGTSAKESLSEPPHTNGCGVPQTT